MSSTSSRKTRKKQDRTHSSRVGADDALDQLVGQFADPLVFLRELVQNSLDAGATAIDVDFSLAPKRGAAKSGKRLGTITVTDNGEGMNEGIIDKYLLTLFSSTKEGDLTKIGKFGVGFVSIFAIEPELVVLETGQAGEAWRILFHPDRSYEKLRLEEPVEGTTVALHKHYGGKDFRKLGKRGADVVRHWCKYAEAEIRVDGERVAEDFGISAALSLQHEEPGTSIAIGFAPVAEPRSTAWHVLDRANAAGATKPLIGFYNRGLTLIETDHPPGEEATLAGLSLRVKSRHLEHTLTRDNVLIDENYERVIARVSELVAGPLRAKLIAHAEAQAAFHSGVESAAPDPGAPELGETLLYARLSGMKLDERAQGCRLIPTTDGTAVSLRQLRKQRSPTDGVPFAYRSTPVTRLLAAEGVQCVRDAGGSVAHLRLRELEMVPVNVFWYTAAPVEVDDTTTTLMDRVRVLLKAAKVRANRVALGDFDYPDSPVKGLLYVRQSDAFELSKLGEEEATFFGGARHIVLSSNHALVTDCITIARSRPGIAAELLAQAICAVEQSDVKRRQRITRKASGWSAKP
jgi:hypothetical protein